MNEDPNEKLSRHMTLTVNISPKHLSQETLDMLRAEQVIPGAGVPYRILRHTDEVAVGTWRNISDDPVNPRDDKALIPPGQTLKNFSTAKLPFEPETEWLITHPGLGSMREGYPGIPEDIEQLLLFLEDCEADSALVSGMLGGRFDEWLPVYENDEYCDDSYALAHPEIFEEVGEAMRQFEKKYDKERAAAAKKPGKQEEK